MTKIRKFVETKSQEDIWKFLEIYRNRESMGIQMVSTSEQHGTGTWKEAADHFLGTTLLKMMSKITYPFRRILD